MTDSRQFNGIVLCGRGGVKICEDPGHLRVHSGGFVWRQQGGEKVLENDKSNIGTIDWMTKIPMVFELHLRLIRGGFFYNFIALREQDVTSLSRFIRKNIGIKPGMKKDRNAPKRAMSAFMLFCNSETDNIKKANPRLASIEVTKALEDKWKELPGIMKEIKPSKTMIEEYEIMEYEDVKRYKNERALYKSPVLLLLSTGDESD